MNPHDLIDPTLAPAAPAPFWFVQLFKVLGFTLHLVPMNLWYAGMILAVALHWRGGEHGRSFGRRLMAQMPILIAFGINLGIVPLLFLQVSYYKVFYPATILMAWFWMSIFVALIPAYYGVYVYAFGLRDEAGMVWWKRAAGWIAAVLFLWIGFIMANGLSLSTNVGGWPAIWTSHSVAGAATGTGLNTADPTLWPRWLLMFGLALGTTAAWSVVDAAWLADRESPEYRKWASGWALKLITASVLVVAGAGSWYAFGTWRPEVGRVMFFTLPGVLLFAVTAASPGLPWLLIFVNRNRQLARGMAVWIGLAQLGVLALNAVSRQIVQNVELQPYFDVTKRAVATQWGPLAMFLIAFAIGAGIVAWMLAQAIKARPTQSG